MHLIPWFACPSFRSRIAILTTITAKKFIYKNKHSEINALFGFQQFWEVGDKKEGEEGIKE
jgi:hypothetical protein